VAEKTIKNRRFLFRDRRHGGHDFYLEVMDDRLHDWVHLNHIAIMNRIKPPLLRRFPALMAALFAGMGALHAGEVALRNKDGKSLTARLLDIKGDKLTVMREADKKRFTLDLAQLDDASRAKVDDWVKAGGHLSERYVIEFSSGKSGKNSSQYYDDDRTVNMEPVIVVRNPDPNAATKPAKVTALLLGRPLNERGAYHVFATETFDLPSLEGGKQTPFLMKRFKHTYDGRGDYKYGSRYLGWVVLIHDPENKRVIHSQSVPTTLAGKHGGKFLDLKADSIYDAELRDMK
jgi:hypothetical protein